MCTDYIKSHIMSLPETQIFSTREMLQHGKRGAVDQALSRLVHSHFIIRLARGVFVKDDSLRPSLEEIVKAKMAAWNKSIFTYAENLLVDLELVPPAQLVASAMAVDAHSSSFDTIEGRVLLKGIGTRRVRLCETWAGQIAYALWHLKEKVCTERHVSIATKNLKRTEREDLRTAAAMMPGWLSDLCRFRFPASRKRFN